MACGDRETEDRDPYHQRRKRRGEAAAVSPAGERLPQLLAELAALRARADQAFARVKAAHPALVACRPGCADCCHALFDLSPIEALALARAFPSLPRPLRRETLRRAEKAAKDFDRAVAVAQGLAGGERLDSLGRARVACPLLAKGRCLLHPERPLTCRLYGIPVAVGGVARLCPRAGFLPGHTYPAADLDQVNRELDALSVRALCLLPDLPSARRDLARVLLAA